MKTLVTYYSESGNTKKVAEKIFTEIKTDKEILEIHNVKSFNDYDLVFIGTPILQFSMAKNVKDILKQKNIEAKTALFLTHAMSKKSPQLEPILEKCKAQFNGNNFIGIFSCQGELSLEAAKQMNASNIAKLQNFAKMRNATIGHPSVSELENVSQFVSATMKSVIG